MRQFSGIMITATQLAIGFIIGYALVRGWRPILAALAVALALVSGVSPWVVTAAAAAVCGIAAVRER